MPERQEQRKEENGVHVFSAVADAWQIETDRQTDPQKPQNEDVGKLTSAGMVWDRRVTGVAELQDHSA